MNDATFQACHRLHGDLPRFLTTTFSARDLEQIRVALGEPELTAYLVSYGTTIGQIYVNMFPSRTGRIILEGVDSARPGRLLGGFGLTSLDNITDAWNDGFLGECIAAGADNCSLASPVNGKIVTLDGLKERLNVLLKALVKRPAAAHSEDSEPSIITYSVMLQILLYALVSPFRWPDIADMIAGMEAGNWTLATMYADATWSHRPDVKEKRPNPNEFVSMVICSDAYDSSPPVEGLEWWVSLWRDMTEKSWIGARNSFFRDFPCQNFIKYWPKPAEVYRGDFNKTLQNPILLISSTYDPATPLIHAQNLLKEMGRNARLIVHHGYGHLARDTSNCTQYIAARYMQYGTIPEEAETPCYANEKPYRYSAASLDLSA